MKFAIILSLILLHVDLLLAQGLSCGVPDPPSKGLCAAVTALTPTETAFQADFSQSAPGACASVLTQTEACKAAADKAAFACAEALSPNIAQAASVVKMGMGLLGQMSGANDPCDGFADAMKKAGNAITLFETACSAAKIMAETSCKTAATSATACGAELKAKAAPAKTTGQNATTLGAKAADATSAQAAAGAAETTVSPVTILGQYMPSVSADQAQVQNFATTSETQAQSAATFASNPVTKTLEPGAAKAAGASAGGAGKIATKSALAAEKKSGDADALSAGLTAVSTAAGGYAMTLASAGMGLMSMMKAQGQANNCKDKTTANDCSKNPSAPGCGGAASPNVDCSGRDVNSSICVCAANPRQPGCDKTLAGTQFGHLVERKPGTNTDVSAPALPGAPALAPGESSTPTTAGSGGSGSGKGGLGGGGGLAGGGADKSKPTEKGSDATSGAGGFGSGGGGSGIGRGGGGYTEGKYDKYLPGGKEANRSVAGAGEVTGKMGKSNWDKIHDRYRDNVPKLKVEGR